jgi:ubiquinone/menaquinone biosynthesis C-methylase UbiE
MNNSKNSWNKHYQNSKSLLIYPDENLVRMLSQTKQETSNIINEHAIDIGCGSGRHLKLMSELGFTSLIGIDMAYNALDLCRQHYNLPLAQCLNHQIPFKDNTFKTAVCWGGLHYTNKENFMLQLKEIYRIISPGGYLIGTLRTVHDTVLKNGKNLGNNTWVTDLADIENSTISLYSEEELQKVLSIFSSSQYGIMERSTLGNINNKISHWYFKAVK